jgi:hypothetical protein
MKGGGGSAGRLAIEPYWGFETTFRTHLKNDFWANILFLSRVLTDAHKKEEI